MASPDSDWRATASFENLQDGFRVRLLVSAHDGTAWSPIDIAGDGVGYTYPFLKYWSPDSRYFFFAERVAGGSCDFFPIEDHWKRLDVRTGKLDDYPLPEGRGHAISRDGSLLAYASAGPPNQVIIEDLAGGVDLSLDLHSTVAQAGISFGMRNPPPSPSRLQQRPSVMRRSFPSRSSALTSVAPSSRH